VRIATWNVNSLKARLEKVEWWLERAAPDVLLLQETKLCDETAPVLPFSMAGYELLHHGEGRWNGVAVASRVGLAEVVSNFGDGPVRSSAAGVSVPGAEEDFDPFHEARMVSAVCGGVRVVSVYAPNGREVGSPFYAGKLAWFARLRCWLDETQDPRAPGLGAAGRVAGAESDASTLHLVGLPRRQLPARRGDADRPPPGDRSGCRARRRGRGGPRGPQGQARPVRPRAARPGPGRAGPGVRSGLVRRGGADRGSDRRTANQRRRLTPRRRRHAVGVDPLAGVLAGQNDQERGSPGRNPASRRRSDVVRANLPGRGVALLATLAVLVVACSDAEPTTDILQGGGFGV